MSRMLLLVTLLAAGTAAAQPFHHVELHGGPPLGPGAPSPEALATVPNLSADQQVEVRKILNQRRDAHDALRAKEETERNTAMARSRSEHERIDDESSARLRKLLGEDGYRALATWLVDAHGPKIRRMHTLPGPGGAAPPDGPGAALGGFDDEDDAPPVR